MGTTIKIIPPQGLEQTINTYEKCTVTLSATSKIGSFSLALADTTGDLVDAFPVGSDVSIVQNNHIFRGWILNPTKQVDGNIVRLQLEGVCYTGRTQRIVVTEAYVSQKISDIVKDLFTKYMPDVDQVGIIACDKVISIKFGDEFLFYCMEQLANLAGYEWAIYEPTPEEVAPGMESSGWSELVELVAPISVAETHGWTEHVQYLIYYPPLPSETLYPNETLYPY